MKHILLAGAAFAALCCALPASAQSFNDIRAAADQAASQNRTGALAGVISVEQSGANSEAVVTQNGGRAVATIRQQGTDGARAAIPQQGGDLADSQAEITQESTLADASARGSAAISQITTGERANKAEVSQTLGAPTSSGVVDQIGFGNSARIRTLFAQQGEQAVVRQNGWDLNASIYQQLGGSASIEQWGFDGAPSYDNRADIEQLASAGSVATVAQSGSGHSATIDQVVNGDSMVSVTQTGADNTLVFSGRHGSGNAATVTQSGVGAQASIGQTGGDNTIVLDQTGLAHANIGQDGTGNTALVSQVGMGSSATIMQAGLGNTAIIHQ